MNTRFVIIVALFLFAGAIAATLYILINKKSDDCDIPCYNIDASGDCVLCPDVICDGDEKPVCVNEECGCPAPPPPPPITGISDRSKVALSYLSTVYPIVPNVIWKSLTDESIIKLYTSLSWYYTPMPLDVGQQSLILPYKNGSVNTKQERSVFSRRAPLVADNYNITTEAYLTDGQDQVQLMSAVSQSGPPNFDPDTSCIGSKSGFTGVMPDNKYYNPVIENYDDGTSGVVSNWWPAYTDPNPENPLKDKSTSDGVCSFPGEICVNAQPGGAKNIFNSDDPTKGGYNYCFSGAAGAYASAFPASPMGPTWDMGMKPCKPEDLDFTGTNPSNSTGQPAISSKCIADLYGIELEKDGTISTDFSAMMKKAKSSDRTSKKFQFVNLIDPYGRKHGCPNFGYMEGVAYVMEGLGKILLNAPDCSQGMTPSAIGSLSRVAWCPPSDSGKKSVTFNKDTKKNVEIDTVTCDPDDHDTCKTNAKNLKDMSGAVEFFKNKFESKEDVINLRNDYSFNRGSYSSNPYTPGSCSGCCSSNTISSIGITNPETLPSDSDALENGNRDTYNMAKPEGEDTCIQNQYGSDCTGSKIMFYWMNGYGKFLNMGLTGIYSNYIGFMLSCPNQPWYVTDPKKGPYIRRTLPQVAAIGLGGGAKKQLSQFTSGIGFQDYRRNLTGYCTTFQTGVIDSRGQPMSLVANNFSYALNKTVPYKYDFEATETDWETCVIIITGRMLFAKKWGPHILPDKKTASVWKNKKMDASLLQKSMKNDWYGRKFAGMNLPDDMKEASGIGNSQGLLNPQEGIEGYVTSGGTKITETGDINLCRIATQTIQCYYPPNLLISNPSYKKYVNMTPQQGAVLWQGMYVMGDSGADWFGYQEGNATCAQVSDPTSCPSWPFGTYYFAANIGGCVYGMTAALGWNSSQFTVMSTGGGGSKACDYPNYDYEIVYIGGSKLKKRVCTNSIQKDDKTYDDDVYGFKLLDISGNGYSSLIDYYAQEKYVQGSSAGLTDEINDLITCIDDGTGPKWGGKDRVKAFRDLFSKFKERYQADNSRYSQKPFSTCVMPLNEMNVSEDIWGKNRPNALFYNEPNGTCKPVTDKKSYDKYVECESKGNVASSWPFGIENSGASDCPYKDGTSGMRQEAIDNGVKSLFKFDTYTG